MMMLTALHYLKKINHVSFLSTSYKIPTFDQFDRLNKLSQKQDQIKHIMHYIDSFCVPKFILMCNSNSERKVNLKFLNYNSDKTARKSRWKDLKT